MRQMSKDVACQHPANSARLSFFQFGNDCQTSGGVLMNRKELLLRLLSCPIYVSWGKSLTRTPEDFGFSISDYTVQL